MNKSPFVQKEEEILKFWEQNKIFEKSVLERPEDNTYVFYDGPPFATGLPHYGHILSSTLKDVFPRNHTMKGKRVNRRWGWDCHGLPIENIAEKELGIKTKKEIEKMGVDKFNEFCRLKVLGYVDEWKEIIRRLGRWVDMENAYKTMDLDYMESVWWVFKQLWDKGLIYEGYRSMHICPRCGTTLSQYEVAEGYKDIKDLSLTAKFELADEPGTYLLAWTTTPWTLIGNVALAVGEDIDYIKFSLKDYPGITDGIYIVSKKDFSNYEKEIKEKIKNSNARVEILRELKGKDLVGKKYKPLFDYYAKDKSLENYQNGWKVVGADFVTTDEGTGIVHIAPAFGEEDMDLGNQLNLPFIQHVGMDGIIKNGCGEFSGLSVKPIDDLRATDRKIIKYLKDKDLLFLEEEYAHSYPHCWRCDTPLINYATSSWFVAVEKIKPKALDLAKDINWFPEHIKGGRFGKWLEGAKDWSISRQRYWACAIPIWECERNPEHKKVIGSVEELEKLSGQKISDLHKHIIDKVTFKCEKCGGVMRRISDVLDCWFESGSMPYAQFHYPFDPNSISPQCSGNYGAKNEEKIGELCPPREFPAEFIGEGIDQTRAWFYYLHILSTAIMQKPAYKNVIVNGIVLAEDGKKMSKRLKNYPDPVEIFDKYGADALRYYLMGSAAMQADNLFFKEANLREGYNKVINPIYNAVSFYNIYKENFTFEEIDFNQLCLLDRWIISRLREFIKETQKYYDSYNTVKVAREIRDFVDDFSTWWLRRSRERFREDNDEAKKAFNTLVYTLREFAKVIAPLLPFLAEYIWQQLKTEDDQISIHLELWPEYKELSYDKDLIKDMKTAREIVELGHSLRAENGFKVRQPLAKIYWNSSFKIDDRELTSLILEELNIEKFADKNEIKNKKEIERGKLQVVIEATVDERLKQLGDLRELIHFIQQSRKKRNLKVGELISAEYFAEDAPAKEFMQKNKKTIIEATSLKDITLASNKGENFYPVEISKGLIYLKLGENS